MLQAARGAAYAARNNNKETLLRATSLLLSPRVGVWTSGGGEKSTITTMATSTSTMTTSPIGNGAAQRRTKTDLSALHHPSLVGAWV